MDRYRVDHTTFAIFLNKNKDPQSKGTRGRREKVKRLNNQYVDIPDIHVS